MKNKPIRLIFHFMKLSVYVFVIQLSAMQLLVASETNGQNSRSVWDTFVSLDLNEASLTETLGHLESISGYYFNYDKSDIRTKKKISLKFKNAPVADVLMNLSKEYSLGFKQLNNTIQIDKLHGKPTAKQQVQIVSADVEVKGTITDETGEGLPGASVVVKGTSIGTTSGLDGSYRLSAPEDAVLVVSFVGYKTQEIPLSGRSVIDLQLAVDAEQLEEVVVIGYGEKSKRDVTTAISQISSEKITKRFSMSPEMAMQGQMAGVQVSGNNGDPMSRPTIRVRGTNTWGVADPVYVVDGVMLEEYGAGIEGQTDNGNYRRGAVNVMSLINPEDIESITVLKDASAAAIYGVRAANGVVLITTKSGISGKPKVSFSSRLGWTSITKRVNVLNSKQYTDFNNALWATDPNSEIVAEDLRVFDPSSPHYRGNAPTTDWQKAVENQNAMTKDYSINFSGGTKAVNYFVSFGKSNQDGVYIGNYMDRLSGTFKLNMDINPWLRAGFNGRISSTESGRAGSNTISAAGKPPFQPIYDPNGVNGKGFAEVLEGYDANGNWTGTRLFGRNTSANTPAVLALDDLLYSGLRSTGRSYLEIEPIKDLKIRGAYSIDNTLTGTNKIYPRETNWYSPQGADPESSSVPGSLGSYNVISGNNITNQFDITANYQRLIGDHKIDILVGAMGNNHSYEYRELYSENISSIDRDLVRLGSGVTNSAFIFKEESARFGSFLRTGYNYASKYYLDFAIRRDGSSSFAPDHRWGVFPAVSAAWRLSTEPFMSEVSFVNDFKVRVGYGKLGNDEVTKNAYLSTINKRPNYVWGNTNGGYGTINDAATVFGLPNPTLSWETTTTINVGFDSRLFNGLDFSLEYYDKLTEGLLQGVVIPLSSGIIHGPEANVGDVSNKGIEMTFNYSKTVSDISFSIGGNLTTQKNEVLKVYGGIPISTNAGRIEVGRPIGFLRGPVYDGTFQSDQEALAWMNQTIDVSYNAPLVTAGDYYFKDLYGAPSDESEFFSSNPDGQVDQFDQAYLGKTTPGYYYGLNFNIGYKGLSLDMVFYGVGDIQKYNSIRQFSNPSVNGTNRSIEVLNAWTSSNPNTNLPRMIWGDPANNFRFSSLFVEDADYLRLANVRLNYVFPPSFYQSVGNYISNLSIYVGSSNTFTLTGYSGLDPESDDNPSPRMFYTGFSINF